LNSLKKLIAFDVDGTLLDNSELFVAAYRRMVPKFNEKTGLSVPLRRDPIMGVVGLPPVEIFTGLMPEVDMRFCDLMLRLFMDELEYGIRNGATSLYEGVQSSLERLYAEGYTLAVASNGVRSYIETVINHFDIARAFSLPVIVVEGVIKNKDDILAAYIDRIRPDFTVMVGDRYTDREAARSCSAPFIACAFGHGDHSEIHGEHHVVSAFDEVYDMIKRIEREHGVE